MAGGYCWWKIFRGNEKIMNIKECGERICYLLIQSSYESEAAEIHSLVNKILTSGEDDNDRAIAIENLISRCHPKWLGDYYINGISYVEWTNLISLFKTKLNSA